MEQLSVKQVLDVVNVLIKPQSDCPSKDLVNALVNNLKRASEITQLVIKLENIKKECNIDCSIDDISWTYACTCLEVLLCLKNLLKADDNELLSITQHKSIKDLFQFIISMGLLPYLLPGVGLGIDQRCPNASPFKNLILDDISDTEKYRRICGVTRGLLLLSEEQSISGLLLSKHMEDLFAALCQLTMPKYKHPTPELISDRDYFQSKFQHLISKLYQPFVINSLMILQGNKDSPRWLKLGISRLLTQRLMVEGGVIATVKAIQQTVNYENPKVITKLESIANLIVTPHIKDGDSYFTIVIPQVMKLIYSEDVNLMRIGVVCCRVLYEKNNDSFNRHVLPTLMEPLLSCSISTTENEITRCIQALHKCFAIPGSDMWGVPVEPIVTLSKLIYKIYCKLCDSPSLIKKPVEDLLWTIMTKLSSERLDRIFCCLLLDINADDIKEFPEDLNFIFGDEGCIKIGLLVDENPNNIIVYSKCILKLLEERDTSGKISKQLFLTLLNYSSTLGNDLSEIKIYVTEMLAELSETEAIQKTITKDSQPIVNFIESLIVNKLKSGSNDYEILCIALVLLIAVMDEIKSDDTLNWDKLKTVSASLPKLSARTNNIEFKMLCDEIYNRILTHNVIKDHNDRSFNINDRRSKTKGSTKSSFEKALDDACDPLLPVRGHAILELTKFIVAGDNEAKAKKDAIFCIFKENLKNEDSYLYLSAIEGMASLATEFPDTVLVTLSEEYTRTTETTVRLKVGEVLMRVVRLLGEMVPVYKNELLNSFLSGVRDPDNLVRASSLSNVGEICRILSFRIGSIAAEILNCVECVVATDHAPEPRRAAVMLVTLILRGLGSDALNALESVLLRLYRTLKKIYQTDKDDVVKLHSQLAIEELNNATISFLFPSETLTKRIYVLDPPS